MAETLSRCVRRLRRTLAAATLAAGVLSTSAGPLAAAGCLLPPVDAAVLRGFEAPPCPYCAGHRGVTFDVAPGTPVRAAAAGTVTFSGVVVDVRYVVVRHADGILATYGGLRSTELVTGDAVAAGAQVGSSGVGLYFGLRAGPDAYLDPAPLLGRMSVPPYLVPTDGSGRRRPPAPRVECRRGPEPISSLRPIHRWASPS